MTRSGAILACKRPGSVCQVLQVLNNSAFTVAVYLKLTANVHLMAGYGFLGTRGIVKVYATKVLHMTTQIIIS